MQRSIHLSNTEKIVSDMTTSEKIKPLKLNNLLNTDEFNEMRVKLKNLRQKVSKNKHIKLENIN